MGAARTENAAHASNVPQQHAPAQDEVLGHPRWLLVDAGVRLDLTVYELPGEKLLGLDVEYLLRPAGELEGLGVRQPKKILRDQSALKKTRHPNVIGNE